MTEDFLESGYILKDRYQIIDPIKAGTNGGIYIAKDLNTGEVIAIKELSVTSKTLNKMKDLILNFKEENDILSSLKHPSIPKMIDFFNFGRGYYMAMDYIDGDDLETIVDETRREGLHEKKVLEWSLAICSIIEYLHSQTPPVIYGDLKPANIVLRNSDSRLFLIDFGLARFLNHKSGIPVGTEGYAPPEQYKGELDTRSDIYSLGATIYHLLVATPPGKPSQFTPMKTIKPYISEEMDYVISKALKMDSINRYQTISEFRYNLAEIYAKYYGHHPTVELTDNEFEKIRKIKVLLVDDDQVMRTLFKSIIKRTSDIELIGEAVNGKAALEKIKDTHNQADVILMDINMPGIDGIETTKLIIEQDRQAKIIMLTALSETRIIRKAFMAGAKGYMLKGGSIKSVTDGIRKAYRGGLPIDTRISGIIQKEKEARLMEGSFKKTVFSSDNIMDLSKNSFINILVYFYSNKEPGKITLKNEKETGEIWFNKESISHAVLGNLKGENAVYSFLTWEEGEAHYTPDINEEEETINIEGQKFISRCLKKNRELARIKLSLSSPYDIPILNTQEYQVISLTSDEIELLNYINGKKSIMEISQICKKSYFDTIKSLYKMMTTGLVKKVT